MMSLKRFTPRILQATMGLLVLCAFAVVPMTAQAETVGTTPLNGAVNAGALSVLAPEAIAMPAVSVTGSAQTAKQEVKEWQFADLTGKEEGYSVVVSAPVMKITTSDRYTIALKSAQAVATDPTAVAEAAAGNAPENKAESATLVGEAEEAATVQEAAATKGNGQWEVPAGANYIEVGIPALTPSGTYTSALTFTISALV